MFLMEVVDALESHRVKYAIVGGYALALHGIVRATMDIDLVVNITRRQMQEFEKAMHSIGLASRLPITAADVFNFREEYIHNRNMVAWSFVDYKNPTRIVDILITLSLKEIQTDRIQVSGRKIKIASLTELLKMKKQANRDQDRVDILRIQEKLSEKK